MDVARSSFYADPGPKPGDTVIIEDIRAITSDLEGYGYRRVDAELRHRGMVLSSKKVRRLMRENGLNPRRRRRTTRTTDSDHGGLIFPFIAKELEVYGPDQLWVADLTYITIAGGFVYATLAPCSDRWRNRARSWTRGRAVLSAAPSAAASTPAWRRGRSAARSRSGVPCPAACSTRTADPSTRRSCIEAFLPNRASSDL